MSKIREEDVKLDNLRVEIESHVEESSEWSSFLFAEMTNLSATSHEDGLKVPILSETACPFCKVFRGDIGKNVIVARVSD